MSSNDENKDGVSGDTEALMKFESCKKSTGIAYLLWFFLGGLGAHRFYIGYKGSAIAMLIITIVSLILVAFAIGFLGLLVIGIWLVVDAFLIPGMVRDKNMELLNAIKRGDNL